MREDIANLLSDEAVRAWIYRVALTVTVGVVVVAVLVALVSGVDPKVFIATVTTVTALVSSALATVNTSTDS